MSLTITPRELHTRIAQGEHLLLVDVRSPGEHAAIHVPGVILMPLDRLEAGALPTHRGVAHLLCQSGGRATRAAELLTAAGVPCVVVEGGTAAWAAAGLPVNRGAGVISLERQVRIATGSAVLLGLGLGLVAHPGFFGVAAFVGAGLVFAGVSGWCGLGLLLARAPWNQQVAGETGTGAAQQAAGR